MSLPEGLPDLPFDADQETYDAWFKTCMAKVDGTFLRVDINDGVLNYLCLHAVAELHPDKVEKIHEICPQVVRDAMSELGMAMGAANIANLLDLEVDPVVDLMFAPYKQSS